STLLSSRSGACRTRLSHDVKVAVARALYALAGIPFPHRQRLEACQGQAVADLPERVRVFAENLLELAKHLRAPGVTVGAAVIVGVTGAAVIVGVTGVSVIGDVTGQPHFPAAVFLLVAVLPRQTVILPG